MNTTKFVLTYPKDMPASGALGTNEEHYKRYYSDSYVGLDSGSGGYPYPQKNIQRAEWFSTVEEISNVLNHFPYFKVNLLSIRVENIFRVEGI